MRKPWASRSIFRTALIFLLSYAAFLLLWIQVRGAYGHAITLTASNLVAFLKQVELERLTRKDDVMEATFWPYRSSEEILIDITVETDSYTFNVPLTCAILASLHPFLRWTRRAYAEALIILLAVHLLYVTTLESNLLTELSMNMGLEEVSRPRLFLHQFLWGFTDNMVVRFEPFLIGFYVFARFRNGA